MVEHYGRLKDLTQTLGRALRFLVPAMIGLSSVFSLYAANASSVPVDQVVSPSVVVIALATIGVLICRVLKMNSSIGLLVTSWVVLSVSTYGHVYDQVEGLTVFGVMVGRHRVLMLAILLVTMAIPAFLGRRNTLAARVEQSVMFFGTILFTLSALSMASEYWTNRNLEQERHNGAVSSAQAIENIEVGPDIYYIILDGHARADVLEELYDYDAGSFNNYLESRGFYIADESRANYIQTVLSLSSSLNMNYVDVIADERDMTLTRSNLDDLIRENHVFEIVREHGYKTVTFETGFRNVNMTNADYYFQLPSYSTPESQFREFELSTFEGLYLDTTLVGRVWKIYRKFNPYRGSPHASNHLRHHRRVRSTLEALPEVANRPGSYFVLAHVISPHPPFVFDEDGSFLSPDRPFTFSDGSGFMEEGTRPEYINGYRDQIAYLHELIVQAIEDILENSKERPIIILQADHGPGAYLDWHSADQSNLRERVSILNAYLVPAGVQSELYPSITPVNTFRILLPRILSISPMPRLVDVSYYSTLEDRFSLTPVPESVH